MKFSRNDFISCLITGLTAGIISWRITAFLDINLILNLPIWSLVFIIPILWIVGVKLGYFLGQWFNFFNRLGKFAAVGFTSFTVDMMTLNLLFFIFGITTGVAYPIFKTISFSIAIAHSYIWNRYWVFGSSEYNPVGPELLKFIGVVAVGLIINVSVSSFVASIIGPHFGLSLHAWANISAISGAAAALLSSFIGFGSVVFKNKL